MVVKIARTSTAFVASLIGATVSLLWISGVIG